MTSAKGCRLPDEELLRFASEGKLSDPRILDQQVDRMLNDVKSRRFVDDFLNQWLLLREIKRTTPDVKLYPEFDELLSQAMLAETQLFFNELIQANLPARNLIDSDFTFVNRRLAEHYNIPGIEGQEMRKVMLPEESPRGGILTHGSILKVTANGTVTSPVQRGAFVLSNLMGTPPTPPPPGVGSIEPDTRGTTTIRETLAAHRNVASCASCHKTIDPPGFALESFDPIGGFRTRYRSTGKGDTPEEKLHGRRISEYRLSQPVDASGKTAEGDEFAGFIEFREQLLEKDEQIARNLAQQLAVYATGGEIEFADREVIDRIMKKGRNDGFRVRNMIHEIVRSRLFLER